jgi:hypothetical protein
MVNTVGPASMRPVADGDLAHLASGAASALEHCHVKAPRGELHCCRQSADAGANDYNSVGSHV